MPGTVVVPPGSFAPIVHVIAYSADSLIDERIDDVNRLPHYLAQYPVTWVNVDGLGNASLIQLLGEMFGLHDLAMEDVVSVDQRAKVDPYESNLFMVVRMMEFKDRHVETEQLSLFLGKNFVLTFQERPGGDSFDPVRERIRKNSGRIRRAGADHLAHALVDAIVDSYFPAVDKFADQLDELEINVAEHQGRDVTHQIHELRNELLLLRRAIRPLRDAINELIRDDHPLIHADTRVFLRDCYDHTVQLIDLLEVYRETCSSLRDYQVSVINNRMNEIMKVLTIISTIFIPLSFIAGIYGMNFDTRWPWNMPELRYRYGYPIIMGLMTLIGLGLIGFFWRKGWIDPLRRKAHHE
jgi:magnesium transporter